MGKNLSAYLNALGPLVRKSVIHEPEQVIRGVANDSRRVGKDFIFCAIKGAKSDGHCFIFDAVRNGASVIFTSDEVTVPEWISVIYVSDSYHAWGVLCAEFFDNPADHLDIFAVTGTNGKTSIAFMLKRILMAHGLPAAVSTVEYERRRGKAPPEEAARTTPDSYSIQELFARMLRNGCRCAVIEASSHGLHQHRTGNVRFARRDLHQSDGRPFGLPSYNGGVLSGEKNCFSARCCAPAPRRSSILTTNGEAASCLSFRGKES